MGYRISWVGCPIRDKEKVLAAAELQETGESADALDCSFAGAEIPGDWYILFANDYGFVTSKRLIILSEKTHVIACHLHQTVMVSGAYCYANGKPVWEVTHDLENGVYDLSFSGDMPEEFETIRQRLFKEQDDDGGESSDVDFISDIPVETATSVCGFLHDKISYEWGERAFTRLNLPRRSLRWWPFSR